MELGSAVFYRTMLPTVISAMALCPSVIVRDGQTNRASFLHASFLGPVLQVPPEIRVLPSGTLAQTLDLDNFATPSQSTKLVDS